MARTQIEAHGGVVEKFIGDAVVGIFGVPAAHEDDPERAVRAGLRIAEDAEELEGRRGSTAPSARRDQHRGGPGPSRGSRRDRARASSSGDAINTASRIQSVAPEMGVGVGLATYEATALVFDYDGARAGDPQGQVRAGSRLPREGRRGRVSAPTSPGPTTPRSSDGRSTSRSSRGSSTRPSPPTRPSSSRSSASPGSARAGSSPSSAPTSTTKPDLVTWRQGRCLPYGEGITVLGAGGDREGPRGDLGVRPARRRHERSSRRCSRRARSAPGSASACCRCSGSRPTSIGRAGGAVHRVAAVPRARRRAAIRPCSCSRTCTGPTTRCSPSWSTWRDRAEGVPLLVVGTARPELFERHPDYRRGLAERHAHQPRRHCRPRRPRVWCPRCSRPTVIPAELQQPILDRAGGNPLYAEEFVRLLKDKDLLVKSGLELGAAGRGGGALPRLRAGADRRSTGHAGARREVDARRRRGRRARCSGRAPFAAMGERDLAEVTETLRELSRKELVRPARRSSIEGEAEYAFWHVLARDVAYGQLPRASRASRHVAAATWIESKALERVEDLADVLAYHYATALELARAAGETEQAAELEASGAAVPHPGRRARARPRHRRGAANLERALALTPPGHIPNGPERSLASARPPVQAGRYAEAAEALEEAIASFRARRRSRRRRPRHGHSSATRTSTRLGDPRWADARRRRRRRFWSRWRPAPSSSGALTELASVRDPPGEYEAGARSPSGRSRSPRSSASARPARALGYPRYGPRQPRRSRRASRTTVRRSSSRPRPDEGREAALLHNNLGVGALGSSRARSRRWRPPAFGDRLREGPGARRDGETPSRRARLDSLLDRGRDRMRRSRSPPEWRRAWRRAAIVFDLVGFARAGPDPGPARAGRARSLDSLDWLEADRSRSSRTRRLVVFGLGSAALVRAGLGQVERAAALLDRAPGVSGSSGNNGVLGPTPVVGAHRLRIVRRDSRERLVAGLDPPYPYAEHALVAAKRGTRRGPRGPGGRRRCLRRCRRSLGAVRGRPRAGVRAPRSGPLPARALATDRGRTRLQHAREIFERLKAAPALAETDSLLQQTTSPSS